MSSKTVRSVAPPVFRYEPLEPKRSIRLLRISDSDRWDDPIALSLTIYPLIKGAYPEYTALSYTWGRSGRNVEVSIDGARAMITESLFEGLQYLRKTQQQRDDIGGLWWIDMLCINQDCIPERSHQVAMMKDIFQSASLVVAWLGTTNRLEHGTRANPNLQVPSQDSDRPYSRDHCFRRITIMGLHLARDILSRPYWGRVWIIQELCVARDVILLSDSFCISWSNFRSYFKENRQSAAADRFWDFNNPVGRLSVSDFRLLIPYNLVDLRDKIRNYGGQGNLGSLLTFASRSEATNPRDRVYSLLGLANDASEENIPLDYSLSPCTALPSGSFMGISAVAVAVPLVDLPLYCHHVLMNHLPWKMRGEVSVMALIVVPGGVVLISHYWILERKMCPCIIVLARTRLDGLQCCTSSGRGSPYTHPSTTLFTHTNTRDQVFINYRMSRITFFFFFQISGFDGLTPSRMI